MEYWTLEALGIKPGDRVVRRDKPRELIHKDGTTTPLLTAGTAGTVISIHKGLQKQADSYGEPNPAWALVEFDHGETLAVDTLMKWEKPFDLPRCVYETKYAGFRLVACAFDGQCQLVSRKSVNRRL